LAAATFCVAAQHPLRVEMDRLPTLFQSLVRRAHFVLDVEHACLVLGLALIQTEHRLIRGRVKLAVIDRQVETHADLTA